MRLDNVVQIIKPEADSQYRLRPCKCGGDNVAYALGVDGLWRGNCFDCGHSGTGAKVRHDAQQAWNEGVGV